MFYAKILPLRIKSDLQKVVGAERKKKTLNGKHHISRGYLA